MATTPDASTSQRPISTGDPETVAHGQRGSGWSEGKKSRATVPGGVGIHERPKRDKEIKGENDGDAAVPEPLVELRVDHEPVPTGDAGNRLRGRRA